MSDKDDQSPPDDFQKQIQEMMKQASFMFGPGAAAPGAAAESTETVSEEDENDEVLERIRDFNLKPREVRDYLDRFVIQQAEAKKVLSVAICDHYNHVRQCIESPEIADQEYTKQNILLLGPTGVGKTYLMRCIAKLIGVPFVKADATKFSETGYVGNDVDDLVRDLVKVAGGDTDLAQYGIIYIDEIDKISSGDSQGGRDVSGRGVQINLLKLMEDTEVNLQSQTDMVSQMESIMQMQRGGKPKSRTMSTKHILFIVSGAFDRLSERIRKRVGATAIGFNQEEQPENTSEYLAQAETRDFVGYGFEPEFIGRLPIRVTCQPLDVDDLEQVLVTSEGGILSQYRSDFKGYGIDFDITTEALRRIAERAEEEKTGARGLMTVMEKVFREFKFELPSTSVSSFEVTTETIDNNESHLKELLKSNLDSQRVLLRAEVDAFADRFRQESGLTLSFEEAAVDALVELSIEEDRTIRGLCEDKFKDFHHGLKLVSRNSDKTSFSIGADMIRDPGGELSKWIVDSFQKSS